jgi:hypothetical protein
MRAATVVAQTRRQLARLALLWRNGQLRRQYGNDLPQNEHSVAAAIVAVMVPNKQRKIQCKAAQKSASHQHSSLKLSTPTYSLTGNQAPMLNICFVFEGNSPKMGIM